MGEEGNKPNVIDLFCGIGGFSKGFEKAGFQVLFGIDNWDVALKTFEVNHKNSFVINKDISEVEDSFYEKYSGKVDVVIAGPPCQGFSMSGKRDIKDKRNTLFEEVIRSVKILKPKMVVLENVVGLLSMKNSCGEKISEIIKRKLSELGYITEYKVLNASDFGVPQARRRVIFVASKIGKLSFPSPLGWKIKVGDALGNIPDVDKKHYSEPISDFQKSMSDGENKIFNHEAMSHNEKVKNRIKYVPPGGNWKDIPPEYYGVGGVHSNNYRRLDPSRPSITLKHATKSMIIHPKFNRVVTAREVARLQSFPDSFILVGTRFDQHQQLANAVPPLLGYAIAKELIKYLDQTSK